MIQPRRRPSTDAEGGTDEFRSRREVILFDSSAEVEEGIHVRTHRRPVHQRRRLRQGQSLTCLLRLRRPRSRPLDRRSDEAAATAPHGPETYEALAALPEPAHDKGSLSLAATPRTPASPPTPRIRPTLLRRYAARAVNCPAGATAFRLLSAAITLAISPQVSETIRMGDQRPRPEADRILVAQLTGEARHRARWRPLTEEEEAAALAELRALAGGRADLLAEVAGIFEGTSEGEPDEPLARSAARLCRMAGADTGAIPAWIEEGRRRSANARRPPFSGGLS